METTAHTTGSWGTQGLRPDLLGYVFHLSWICLLFYNVVPNAMGDMEAAANPVNALYLISTLTLCAVLAVGIIALKPFMRFAESRWGVFGAPLITAVGSMCCCAHIVFPLTAFIVVGGVLTGIGSAILAARWASVYGSAKSRPVIANLTTVLAVTSILCMTTSYLPDLATFTIVSVLPLASGACLEYARYFQHKLVNHEEKQDDGSSERSRSAKEKTYRPGMLVIMGVFVALIGFVSGGLPQFELGIDALAGWALAFYLIATILMLIFVATLLFLDNREAMLPLFVVPLALLVLFALPFSQFVAGSPIQASYAVGQASFELMLLFGTTLFALLLDLSPARTFMVARVALALSDIAGSLLAAWLVARASTAIGIQFASIAMLIASELVIAALVIFYFMERKRQLPKEEALQQETDETEPTSAAAHTPKSNGELSELSDEQRTASSSSSEPSPLERLATEHGLTARERDVFELLVQGKSPTQIQEELCISQGTTNYHMRNIYAKLGVHSRQELLVMALAPSNDSSTH